MNMDIDKLTCFRFSFRSLLFDDPDFCKSSTAVKNSDYCTQNCRVLTFLGGIFTDVV